MCVLLLLHMLLHMLHMLLLLCLLRRLLRQLLRRRLLHQALRRLPPQRLLQHKGRCGYAGHYAAVQVLLKLLQRFPQRLHAAVG